VPDGLNKRLSNQGAATPALSDGWSCHTASGKMKTSAPAAQHVGATLLHKDPEFRAIANLPQEWLG